MIGQTLSHYRITAKLGEGGMGEVYRAEDTTLDREVALKILPPELAGSQERLERFRREAKTLAALDHPNIVTIHSVEEDDGIHFLTMQLVEGKRLSELIPKGGMPLDRLFELAIPLAEALAAAHEKGVIHRDLKPGNVMVANDGRVKVLDFGLAKLRYDEAGRPGTELPTEPLTDEGRVLGTVPYMSPEQVEGKPLDHRSDLFSLGVMLHEMATGRRPFQASSPASVMSAILRDTPLTVTELNADLPRDLAKIVRRCLVKQPDSRFQTARELAIELKELRSEVESGEAWGSTPFPQRRRRAGVWTLLAAIGIALAAVTSWVLLAARDSQDSVQSAVANSFMQLTFEPGEELDPSLSPDGRYFVYSSNASGNLDIYLQRTGGGRAINLTEDSLVADGEPAYSPDGQQIAFRSERDGGGLFLMGATGENVRRLTDSGHFPAWSPDGSRIVFSTSPTWHPAGSAGEIGGRLRVVRVSTGEVEEVGDRAARRPSWSPTGQRIAAASFLSEGRQADIITMSLDGVTVPVTDDVHFEANPVWSPSTGDLYLVSNRGGPYNVWKVPIDERSGLPSGQAQPVTSATSGVPRGLSFSEDGRRLVYSVWNESTVVAAIDFDPVTAHASGDPEPLTPPSLGSRNVTISPDGQWIAFDAPFGHPNARALGIIGIDRSGLRQLTETVGRDRYPKWSPDGRRLAFRSDRSGSLETWLIDVDGGGLRQVTDTPEGNVGIGAWSPNGQRFANYFLPTDSTLIFDVDAPWGKGSQSVLPRLRERHDGEWQQFWAMSWSKDGELLAGITESGAIAVYSFATRSYRIYPEASGWPTWLSDNRRLLFAGPGISILDTETGESRIVYSHESPSVSVSGELALAPDDRRLFFTQATRSADIWMMTLGEQENEDR